MNTSAKILAEEVLTLMLYGFDLLTMPTFQKWDQSYEGWLYRNGLLRRMQFLEKQKWLIREGKSDEWVYRLTDVGRTRALAGRDPEPRWQRRWDGIWRQIVFDLPVEQQRARKLLLRWFRQNGFGYLQDSVWISPDPVGEVAASVKGFRDNAEAFTVLECRCVAGFHDEVLVRGAWRFDEINCAYKAYQAFAASTAKNLRRERIHPQAVFGLLRKERALWSDAFKLDPLLPVALWPSDYEGRRAWNTRRELLRTFAQQVVAKN